MQVLSKLEELCRRYGELDIELSTPEVLSDPDRLRKVSKEHADLDEIMKAYSALREVLKEISDLEEIINEEQDQEMVELAREDLASQRERKEEIEREIGALLVPRDANDSRNTFLEIRAGTGGEEAALFAADLFRTYCRYAETKGWRVEIMS